MTIMNYRKLGAFLLYLTAGLAAIDSSVSQSAPQEVAPRVYNSVDLVIQRERLLYRDFHITVGIICPSEIECYVDLPTHIQAVINVNINQIDLNQRRHLILECFSNPCTMDVYAMLYKNELMIHSSASRPPVPEKLLSRIE